MDVLTQIEGAAGQHPFLAKLMLIGIVIFVFKFWGSIGPVVVPLVNAALAWLMTPKGNTSPASPAKPITASARVSAIQTLIADAMASGDNQALDNIVAVAKGYQKTATKEALAP